MKRARKCKELHGRSSPGASDSRLPGAGDLWPPGTPVQSFRYQGRGSPAHAGQLSGED